MKEKKQAKYLSDQKPPGKNKKSVFLIVVLVLVLAVVALGVILLLLQGQNPVSPESTTAPTSESVRQEQPVKYASIETAYGPLQFGEEYLGSIRHEEVVEDGVTVEEFSMIQGDDEWELFSICFGDAQEGDLIGRINADGQEIPVSVTVSSYTQEDFPDTETLSDYYVLMDQLDVVLTSIRSGSNFAETGSLTGTETAKQTVQLTYWTVELPESMIWEESTDNNVYQVDFFGTIGGETVHLYTISLGGTSADSILGVYDTDDGKVPVGVKTYSLESQGTWTDDSHFQEYGFMMETINDVIQVITSDAKFSADMS